MSQVAVEIPESAPQEFDHHNDNNNHSDDPETPKQKDGTDDAAAEKPKLKKKSSIKSPTSNTTAVSESPHGSQNPAMWSSPFRTLSKSLIGFFITVLVIARIKSKPSNDSSSAQDQSSSGGGGMPNMMKRKKKTVRILDMSGNLSTPAKNRELTPGTEASGRGSPPVGETDGFWEVKLDNVAGFKDDDEEEERERKKQQELDENSEWKLVYKPLLIKVFIILALGALAAVLWYFLSYYNIV
mmetsp:Transcript_39059/g.94451  ORF Transcript_39059/g.94451 Transcript_39059/m.94451 type:complete len:241 (+) Transcript_39059:300-1022(+)|eukprot:CAMPEP_0113623270 /NCGR_PEP_ID=MMETSP0017_2-20120614/11963_1 /TAXON_ID=2856 /ORGANISM="Cylindrotheca closterium" /LENGTH=240 /DNA_ID=CAMNT_0000533199 /DNA_START=269 /DNA_END=991 /DNA_ORIENTATION=+ /assembly_acc=CAM_ASM_000147